MAQRIHIRIRQTHSRGRSIKVHTQDFASVVGGILSDASEVKISHCHIEQAVGSDLDAASVVALSESKSTSVLSSGAEFHPCRDTKVEAEKYPFGHLLRPMEKA